MNAGPARIYRQSSMRERASGWSWFLSDDDEDSESEDELSSRVEARGPALRAPQATDRAHFGVMGRAGCILLRLFALVMYGRA